MLWTGDLADGGEREAHALYWSLPPPRPPTTSPGNVPGPPVAPRKLSPCHAGDRDRARDRAGRWGQWPAGAPALLWTPPRSRRGKGGAQRRRPRDRAPATPHLSGTSLGWSKATGPSPPRDASHPVPPCAGSGGTAAHGTATPCAPHLTPQPALTVPMLGVHCDPGALTFRQSPDF